MKARGIVIALCIFCLASGYAFAQSGTVFSVGVSYWRAALEFEFEEEDEFDVDWSIKPANLLGPYANVRLGNLVLGGSMFTGTFVVDFGDLFDIWDTKYDLKIKRTDLNFSAGYSLSRNLTLFGAYKDMTYKFEESLTYEDYWTGYETTEKDEWEEKGSFVGGGLSLVFPFPGSSLFAYGSAAYLSAQKEDWSNITTLTVGLGMALQPNLSAMVGYRVDSSSNDDEEGITEKIKGITATLAYTFR
ncbi:MAG TPA: hypothetical protein ENN17_10340 [bacterium]|nr:hypothetical protein [bacterium]